MEDIVGDDVDEEDESLSKKPALKTAHETVEEPGPVDLTNVTVNPDAPLECLGTVETLLDSLAIIKAQTDGEYRILSEGSLVLSESRALVGTVSPLTSASCDAHRFPKPSGPSNSRVMLSG
jgi:H/ACA ribonucleoprotein complex non-core subunit NAF1